MELVLATTIILLAVGGLAAGLLLGRGPVRTSCDGMACLDRSACHDCPHKPAARETGE